MTTNYHTPVAYGAAATSAVVNAPLSQLDTQMTADHAEIVAARGSLASVDARLDIAHNNDGTIKTGAITAQAMINVGDAAATNGDAVRYNEFIVEHNANGTHSLSAVIITKQAQLNVDSVSAASGDLVRHDEFTQDHIAAGSHRTDREIITKQAQVNIDSAAAGSGDVVRHNEFSVEHTAATGVHADNKFTVSMMQASVLSGRGNTAARPAASKAGFLYDNTQTGALQRDNGADYDNVTATFTTTQRDDLTDGGETTLHTHAAHKRTLYVDSSGSASAGVDAAALPVYDNNITEATMVALRIAFQKSADFNRLAVRGQYYASSATKAPHILVAAGGANVDFAMTVATTWTNFTEADTVLDVSGLTNGVTYELTISIVNTLTGTALGKLQYLQVVQYSA